ncbi:pyridoxamine 5'-phosphate oxidase [Halorubellus sp. JP-L1]|uniref:pyridoxamine 5'-phosphate oxidase family protein n=1 Tax=Halorubellus sp. JP-L1 TaxID=2715753 RepID=UPI001409A0AE|nr:pyridoxamine 5'-phosphate oxidase family protein [Halorubellus sp. JP-L1]NHN41070.1 pyridoxamine 5'-phosphate oxidase [Halorubellus sp. JP-L1]
MASDLPDAAVAHLTDRPRIAHLATSHDDTPHCAPIWFTYHDDHVEATITGRKLRDVQANPRVALSLQEDDDGHAKWGLTIHGTAHVVNDPGHADQIHDRINDRYDASPDAWDDNVPIRISIADHQYWEY